MKKSWTSLLGQRAIPLTNIEHLAQVIVSTIEVNEGADAEDVIKTWDGTTAIAVRDAVSHLSKTATPGTVGGAARL